MKSLQTFAPVIDDFGARPAMGKTALAINIISNAAIREKIPCVFFSLEMTAPELATRIISAFSRVNGKTIKKGHLTDAEWGDYATQSSG